MAATPEIYTVYIQVNDDNYITDINSCAYLIDTTNWIEVDKGHGQNYRYARSQYLDKGLQKGNAYYYKYIDNKIVECTEDEILLQQHHYLYKLGSIDNNWEETLIDLTNYKVITIEGTAHLSFYTEEDKKLIAVYNTNRCDISNLSGKYYIHYDYTEEIKAIYLD